MVARSRRRVWACSEGFQATHSRMEIRKNGPATNRDRLKSSISDFSLCFLPLASILVRVPPTFSLHPSYPLQQQELEKMKTGPHSNLQHKDKFKMVAKIWATSPENPKVSLQCSLTPC